MEYDAFISYRRSDGAKAARWLRRELQHFRAPKRLARLRDRRLKIYLDTAYERGTSDFYAATIRPALLASRHLIVVATPNAVKRPAGADDWIVREIEDFASGPNAANVMVVRGAGGADDPLPGDLKARFPNIEIVDLSKVGRLWFLHPMRAARISAEKLKLVAPLLDVAPGEMPLLRQEEERAQQIRLGATSGVTFAVAAAVAGLSIYALRSQFRAQEALDSSLFAVARMVNSVSGMMDRDTDAAARTLLLNEACDLFDKLGREAVRQPRPEAVITCMTERGRARAAQGETADAERQIGEAVALAEKTTAAGASQAVALVLTEAYDALADLSAEQGQAAKAKALRLTLIERAETLGDRFANAALFERAGDAAIAIAVDYQDAGDLKQAIAMGETAIAAFARSEELHTDRSDPAPAEYRADLLVLTGALAEEAGLRDKAVKAYGDAVAIGRRLADEGIATEGGKVGAAEALAALTALTDRQSPDFAARLDEVRGQVAALDRLETDDAA